MCGDKMCHIGTRRAFVRTPSRRVTEIEGSVPERYANSVQLDRVSSSEVSSPPLCALYNRRRCHDQHIRLPHLCGH